MLTVLGGLGEFERELVTVRTSEGRTRAKARGVKFRRPTALMAHHRQEEEAGAFGGVSAQRIEARSLVAALGVAMP
jgi:DNA invertase Pin-like site-specific DNA recombinase